MSLRFGAPCQKVFDLKGSEVTTLSDLELLPKLWGQHKGGRGLLYGPLWVSRGDGFSGLGSRDFILSILASLKERKKFSDYVIGQMELASDEPKKVTMKEFLSMGEEELYDNLTEVRFLLLIYLQFQYFLLAYLKSFFDKTFPDELLESFLFFYSMKSECSGARSSLRTKSFHSLMRTF